LKKTNSGLVSVTLTLHRLESYQEQHHSTCFKQVARRVARCPQSSFQKNETADDHSLIVSCSGGGSLHLRLPDDDARGRVAYLQKFLTARGVVCNEMTDLLDMCGPDGPDLVQLNPS
jgi:hypothetical protein